MALSDSPICRAVAAYPVVFAAMIWWAYPVMVARTSSCSMTMAHSDLRVGIRPRVSRAGKPDDPHVTSIKYAARSLSAVGLWLITVLAGSVSSSADIAPFSRGVPGELPHGWQTQTFRRAGSTKYTLARQDDRVVLAADSRDSASALIAEANVDLVQTPSIEWSWKIDHVLAGAQWGRKSTDDFPARVFVIFADARKSAAALLSESLSRTGMVRALNYVWANDGVAGQMGASPYSGNVIMIAVEAGYSKTGRWVTEHRNVVDDFRRAFHSTPLPTVRAVAIMTDTDNTHAQETTLYGDIRFVR